MRRRSLFPARLLAALCGAALLALAAAPARAQVNPSPPPYYWPPSHCPTPDVRSLPATPGMPAAPGAPAAPSALGTEPVSTSLAADTGAPDLGSEFAPGSGGRNLPAEGYIDLAVPQTMFRLRYDSAYRNNRPDRAEFFYPKCGCFPGAPGPPKPETSVDFQEIWSYLEVALGKRFSVFADVPVRFLNPEMNANTAGLSDIQAGFKYAFVAEGGRWLTFQVRSFFPTGDGGKGLGTDHYSLEPALLAYQRLGERFAVAGEFRDWIPIGGTDFAGNVLRYGVGLSYDVYRRSDLQVSPVGEIVGWTVLSGKEFDALQGQVFGAAGATIINAKVGVRTYLGDHNSIYLGYGRALTGAVWYKDVIRLEYRLTF